MSQPDHARYRAHWQDEIESAALYAAIAEAEPQPQLAEVYRRLAAVEAEHAVAVSVVLSTLGLFGIGAAITLLTGRSVWYTGMRQVLVGLAAAGITFGIGRLIGSSLGG